MSRWEVPAGRWRILRDPPASGAWNMAVDEALARLRREEGVLRIYRWSRPTLSFGRNQEASGRYDPEAFRSLGADVVRRPTGGREVLHDRELTYSIILPLSGPGSLRATYRLVNSALLAALRSLGVNGRMADRRGRTPSPDAGACFRQPAEGEIEVAGRKLVGSAQARVGSNLLQHGSLLLGPATLKLSALALPAGHSGDARGDRDVARAGSGVQASDLPEQEGITLADLVSSPLSFPRVASAVEAALAGSLGGEWDRGTLHEEERELARELQEGYASREWTWRR